MAQHTHFVIRNNFTKSLTLNIEPEGAFFSLDAGEEVSINDVFTTTPVTVTLAHSETGLPIISIWPGDGQVRVEKNGADVLDLIQNGVARH